ncbi:MAG: sulfurtransferase TusA family protein [Gammaproteobacteria bacterium]|nr:sulfurtransferase TusA family protein [Gammaproteobacteria bacterium]
MLNTAQELDARGLNCPLPILRAKKAITSMTQGQVLRVLATDPGSVKDFDAFCKQTGNQLVSSEQNGGEYVFQIRKN